MRFVGVSRRLELFYLNFKMFANILVMILSAQMPQLGKCLNLLENCGQMIHLLNCIIFVVSNKAKGHLKSQEHAYDVPLVATVSTYHQTNRARFCRLIFQKRYKFEFTI